MSQYQWKVRQIEALNVDGLDNVVVTVCFDIDADEEGLKGFVQGDVKLLPPDAQSFTQLADVTEAQVVQWTKDALGADGVARFEGMAQTQIDNQKVAQPKVVPLPWATEEDSVIKPPETSADVEFIN
jgi:hypothetical protein